MIRGDHNPSHNNPSPPITARGRGSWALDKGGKKPPDKQGLLACAPTRRGCDFLVGSVEVPAGVGAAHSVGRIGVGGEEDIGNHSLII